MFEKQIRELLNNLSHGVINSIGSGFILTYQWKEYDNGRWKLYETSFHLQIDAVNMKAKDWQYFEKEADFSWQPKIISIIYDPNWCEWNTSKTKYCGYCD